MGLESYGAYKHGEGYVSMIQHIPRIAQSAMIAAAPVADSL
jgi:hypothetical protein